jgi:hypothetical protein
MRIGCWITKATYTHSEYVILIVALTTATTGMNAPQCYVLRYTFIACLVIQQSKQTHKQYSVVERFGKNLGRSAGLQLRALSRQFSKGERNTMKNTGQDSGLLRFGGL